MKNPAVRLLLLFTVLACPVGLMAQRASFDIGVDASGLSSQEWEACKEKLTTLIATTLSYQQELGPQLVPSGLLVYKKRVGGSLASVTLDLRQKDRVGISVRKYGSSEKTEDDAVSKIVQVFEEYLEAESIEVDSPLGQISS